MLGRLQETNPPFECCNAWRSLRPVLFGAAWNPVTRRTVNCKYCLQRLNNFLLFVIGCFLISSTNLRRLPSMG